MTIRVRRYENGHPTDEVIEYVDQDGVRYGYLLAPDNSFQVLAVGDREEGRFFGKVEIVKVYSASGYLEVSGTRMTNGMGTTEAEREAINLRPFALANEL